MKQRMDPGMLIALLAGTIVAQSIDPWILLIGLILTVAIRAICIWKGR